VNRRELLSGLGIASASTLLWTLGCRSPARPARPEQVGGEVRTWLHDAVAKLLATYPHVHILAATRRRTTAAIDVIGTGVSRTRSDGVVIVVRDQAGRREQVTSDLTANGIEAAVRALGGGQPTPVDFGKPQRFVANLPVDPQRVDDQQLLQRVQLLVRDEDNSRIVYSAGLLDIDDTTVWSMARDHDLEQRLVRIRRTSTRVAWNGTRPIASEITAAWSGGLDDRELTPQELGGATASALELMTPGAFADGERAVLLDPSVAASVIDVTTRSLLTSAALRRPEVARRLSTSAASSVLTLVDDPTAPGAYGGFAFDDEGELAAPLTLLDGGKVVGTLADHAGKGAGRGRRPGHIGRVEPAPSHLRLEAGTLPSMALLGDGLLLEGGLGAVVDPTSDRIVLSAARAREYRGGHRTGHVYADVELVGDLAPLLAATTAVSSDGGTLAYRDEVEGLPRWRSIQTPFLLTRGTVRARRRPLS
jgi:predicted Zn-dependent protease